MKSMLLSGLLTIALAFSGCGGREAAPSEAHTETSAMPFTAETRIETVMSDPAFGDFGRFLFPVQHQYYSGDTLGELLEELAGTGNWLEGRRFRSSASEADITEWLDSLNLNS